MAKSKNYDFSDIPDDNSSISTKYDFSNIPDDTNESSKPSESLVNRAAKDSLRALFGPGISQEITFPIDLSSDLIKKARLNNSLMAKEIGSKFSNEPIFPEFKTEKAAFGNKSLADKTQDYISDLVKENITPRKIAEFGAESALQPEALAGLAGGLLEGGSAGLRNMSRTAEEALSIYGSKEPGFFNTLIKFNKDFDLARTNLTQSQTNFYSKNIKKFIAGINRKFGSSLDNFKGTMTRKEVENALKGPLSVDNEVISKTPSYKEAQNLLDKYSSNESLVNSAKAKQASRLAHEKALANYQTVEDLDTSRFNLTPEESNAIKNPKLKSDKLSAKEIHSIRQRLNSVSDDIGPNSYVNSGFNKQIGSSIPELKELSSNYADIRNKANYAYELFNPFKEGVKPGHKLLLNMGESYRLGKPIADDLSALRGLEQGNKMFPGIGKNPVTRLSIDELVDRLAKIEKTRSKVSTAKVFGLADTLKQGLFKSRTLESLLES